MSTGSDLELPQTALHQEYVPSQEDFTDLTNRAETLDSVIKTLRKERDEYRNEV